MKLDLNKLRSLFYLSPAFLMHAAIHSPLIQFGWTTENMEAEKLPEVVRADLEVGWPGFTCIGVRTEIADALEMISTGPWHVFGGATICLSRRMFSDLGPEDKLEIEKITPEDQSEVCGFLSNQLFRRVLNFHQPIIIQLVEIEEVQSDAGESAVMFIANIITGCTKEEWKKGQQLSELSVQACQLFEDQVKSRELTTGKTVSNGTPTVH